MVDRPRGRGARNGTSSSRPTSAAITLNASSTRESTPSIHHRSPTTPRGIRDLGRRGGTGRSSGGGEPERGGHFPSPEVPEYFVEDLREGFAVVLAARR